MMTAEERETVATSRMSVHQQEMSRVRTNACRTGNLDAARRTVVHLDDSLFTGRTRLALQQGLGGAPEAARLAALTCDAAMSVNHPEEITSLGCGVEEQLRQMEDLARWPGGQFPAAASMWTRRARPVLDGDPEWAPLGGSGRLLAALRQRYAPEICHA
jgi:hypothetical protein